MKKISTIGSICLTLMLVFVLAGCTKQSVTPANVLNTNTAAVSNQITIQNFAFSPQTLMVKAGATVTWSNQDTVGHSIVSSSFSSDIISPGQTFQQTLTQAGTYQYHCGIHPSMTGTIIVQ